jgi:hypothetical protein
MPPHQEFKRRLVALFQEAIQQLSVGQAARWEQVARMPPNRL